MEDIYSARNPPHLNYRRNRHSNHNEICVAHNAYFYLLKRNEIFFYEKIILHLKSPV